MQKYGSSKQFYFLQSYSFFRIAIKMSLKDFNIIAKLGQGAYSSVYKVKRLADSQIYALKKVKMNNLSDKEQQNALNEVRILASVKCPYIAGYKQAFIESNSLCIVMEFSDDGDLYQKILIQQKNKEFFEQNFIWKTLIQVTLGLKSLHDLNILHRDLKSANVFLNKNELAKLGDMNVSKIAKNGLLYTQTGTPYYASPQVWKDKPYDSKSDIWSLGCVIYEMSTLKPPFRAEDMDGLYKKVIKGQYSKIGNGYSDALSNVIKSMLQVNPSNRPNSKQLIRSLAAKAEQLGIEIESNEINAQLLRTIRPNKKLHYLTDVLPKSNYNNGHDDDDMRGKYSQGLKTKASSRQLTLQQNSKSINLPKLDRLILKNGGSKAPLNNSIQKEKISLKPYKIDSSLLKIEGRNNYDKNYDKNYEYPSPKNSYGKDIKAELRKIYNLKPMPSKPPRRLVELPRINQ